jgi:hypothetical protein
VPKGRKKGREAEKKCFIFYALISISYKHMDAEAHTASLGGKIGRGEYVIPYHKCM